MVRGTLLRVGLCIGMCNVRKGARIVGFPAVIFLEVMNLSQSQHRITMVERNRRVMLWGRG